MAATSKQATKSAPVCAGSDKSDSTVAIQNKQPTLSDFSYPLSKTPVNFASVGAIVASINRALSNIDPKTEFGKTVLSQLEPFLKGFLENVDKLFQDCSDVPRSQITDDLFDAIFFRSNDAKRVSKKFSHLCFVPGGRTVCSDASLATLLDALIKRIYLWSSTLENGWKGKGWQGQLDFAEYFVDLAKTLPKQVATTFTVKTKTDDTDADADADRADAADAADSSKPSTKTVTRYDEPWVLQTQRIFRDAAMAARLRKEQQTDKSDSSKPAPRQLPKGHLTQEDIREAKRNSPKSAPPKGTGKGKAKAKPKPKKSTPRKVVDEAGFTTVKRR